MRAWMEALTERLQDAFGARLRFAGLQGSRARGEAGPESDIDAVVILDAVSLQDVRAYRALLEGMPEREKVCGFLRRPAELARWDRADLFQFVHDTIPFYGDLSALTPPLGREDARRAALKGACDIYHGCVHGLLFDRDSAALARFTRWRPLRCAPAVSGRRGSTSSARTTSARASPRRKRACWTAARRRGVDGDGDGLRGAFRAPVRLGGRRHLRAGRR